jgi:hypothetical protein
MITIYGITDEFGQIRYVGHIRNSQQRFAQHQAGMDFNVVGMAILECVETRALVTEAEHKWINFFVGMRWISRKMLGSIPQRSLS